MSTLLARRFGRPIHTSGFTLIEILIALLVLSIGLLGVAAVQFQSLQNSHASYERSIATMQARDLVERLWAGICVLYNADGSIAVGNQGPIIAAWQADHNGVDELEGQVGTFAGRGWEPTLTVDTDTDVWTIEIDWTGPAQGQPEQIRHSFRLPPPLRPDSCP